MDRVDILCRKDGELLHDFSDRVLERLRSGFLFRIASSLFSELLEANVRKEADKDSMIIRHAAECFRSGQVCGEREMSDAFEKTKELDSAFIKKISPAPLRMEIRYGDFEAIRKARIALIMKTVYAILEKWKEPVPFVKAVRMTFTAEEYRDFLRRFLDLYRNESRNLAGSVTLIEAAGPVKDLILGKVFSAMEDVSAGMVEECTQKIYPVRV